MEQDALNDAADVAVLTPAPDAEPAEAADGGTVVDETFAPEQELPAVAESAADEPSSADLTADEPVADPVHDEEPLPMSDSEETVEAVETAETTEPVIAVTVDRTEEVLETIARLQEDLRAEQVVSRQNTEQLLQEVSDLTGKAALLTTTTAAMTVTIQKLSDESEQMVSWSEDVKSAGTLSKLFQAIAILVLVMLLGGVAYLAVKHQKTQQHLYAAEATLAEAIKLQQNQIAEYDKHFASLVGTEFRKEQEESSKVSVQEKLNRLRNGLAEQQLYRKTNGDWFAVNGKNEVALSDPDVIELLNQAFVKSGRALTTPYLVPPHKVVSVLRPNGQGGTDIVVTKELAP